MSIIHTELAKQIQGNNSVLQFTNKVFINPAVLMLVILTNTVFIFTCNFFFITKLLGNSDNSKLDETVLSNIKEDGFEVEKQIDNEFANE